MGYFSQPSDLEWFNALLQFSTSIGEINTELLHKQRTLSLLRKLFTSLFGLNKEVCWQLIGSSDVNRWADWLTGSHVISHVFGLVGEYISLLLTNQHLEEEPPIVEVMCTIFRQQSGRGGSVLWSDWQHDGAAVWGVFQETSQIPQLIRRMMVPEPMITGTLTEVLPELDHIPTVAER